jgi:hypothetical protein
MCPDSVTYRKKGPYLSSIHPSIHSSHPPLSLSLLSLSALVAVASLWLKKKFRRVGGPGEAARDGFFQTEKKRVSIGAQIWTEEVEKILRSSLGRILRSSENYENL